MSAVMACAVRADGATLGSAADQSDRWRLDRYADIGSVRLSIIAVRQLIESAARESRPSRLSLQASSPSHP